MIEFDFRFLFSLCFAAGSPRTLEYDPLLALVRVVCDVSQNEIARLYLSVALQLRELRFVLRLAVGVLAVAIGPSQVTWSSVSE